MDAKYLAEIRAREQAAAVHEYDGITDLIYGRDVKALLAEVERQDQQITTLKKALEIMAMDLYECDDLSNPAIQNALENYIHQASEQEGKK